MPEWYEKECRPFDLYETEDGWFYQAVGTKGNLEEIQAAKIIKALDEMTLNEDIKGIRLRYGGVHGNLHVWASKKLERFKRNDTEYIKLPNIDLNFLNTVFNGEIYFGYVQFGKRTNFSSAQFAEGAYFISAQFRGETDFSGVQFDKKAAFSGVQFGEKTDFTSAQFGGETDFSGAKFGEQTHFRAVRFGGGVNFTKACFENTDFSSARFGEQTSYDDAKFGEVTSFYDAKFGEKAYFRGVQFRGVTNFQGAHFGEITVFSNSQFEGIIDFGFARFKFPAAFANIKYWPDSVKVTLTRWFWKVPILGKVLRCILFLPEHCPEGKPPKYIDLAPDIYRPSIPDRPLEHEGAHLFLDSQNIGAVSNPHFKRYVADQQYLWSFQKDHRRIYWLWRWSSDCGRSIFLWAFWALIIALFFSCAYSHHYWVFGIISLAIGCICLLRNIRRKKCLRLILWAFFSVMIASLLVIAYTPPLSWMLNGWYDFWQKHGAEFQQMTNKYKGKSLNFWSSLYFSIVTFTTLGFGDVAANSPFARLLVTFEVILGYVMLGGLISIFANKLARRA